MKMRSFFLKPKIYLTSNIRRSWIISYIIVLLLPLVIHLFVYLKAYDTIKQQAQESQKAAVEYLRSSMDNEFSRLEEAISTLSYDVNLNYLLNAQGLESFEQNYATASRLYDLNESLLLKIPSDGIVHDYYIFAPKGSLIFHSSGVNAIAQYQTLPGSYTGQLYEICQSLSPQTSNLFVFEPEPNVSYMALMYPLPYSYLPKGYIVLLLEHTKLNTMMQSLYPQPNSQIYLVNESYQLLNYPNSLFNPGIFSDFDFSHGSVLSELPGESGKSLIYSAGSDVLPLHYICTLPESVATEHLIYMRHSLWISFLFCLIGAFFLISIFTQYNYGPWQKLVTTIEKLSKSEVPNGSNEYQIVLNALIDTYQEKATIEEVFYHQNRTLYAFYLARMLTGHIGIENMEEELLENMETQLQLSNYTVLLSLTDVKENWSSNHTELIKDTYLSFFETQIVQKLQNALGSSFSIAFTEVYDYTACVIGMKEEAAENWQAQLASAMETIQQELSESLHVQYCFAFSNLHHNIAEMSTAWDEAFSSISLCVMDQEKSLVFYEDMTFNDAGNYTYPAKSEQTLINLIQIGHSQEAESQIRTLLEETAKHFPVFETAKCIASDILCSVTKAFSRLPDANRERIQMQYYSIVESFMQANSYQKLQQRLLEACTVVCEEFQQAADTATPQSAWIPKIEEQLAANLYDENLNVMFLSHKLGVSAKYLSSIYMEANGVSIMDTIHRRRIDKFKELICKENMNIQDAAMAVGYHSIATLNRWVKKYEGVTPGQLKAIGNHTDSNGETQSS